MRKTFIRGVQISFDKPPSYNPNSAYAESADVREFDRFVAEKGIVEPTMDDLGTFIGHYLDSGRKSTTTSLSHVYNALLARNQLQGQTDAYHALMRRTKVRLNALDLNPHQAPVIPLSKFTSAINNSRRLAGAAKKFVLAGHRTDSWLPSGAGKRPPNISRGEDSLTVCFNTDKKSRQ